MYEQYIGHEMNQEEMENIFKDNLVFFYYKNQSDIEKDRRTIIKITDDISTLLLEIAEWKENHSEVCSIFEGYRVLSGRRRIGRRNIHG